MSLDLNKNSGVAYATGAAITTAAGFTSALFAAGDILPGSNEKFVCKVSTAAGNVDLSTLAAPNTLTFLKDGDTVVFLKSTADNNKIVLNDTTAAIVTPIPMALGPNMNQFTGVGYSFVDTMGESISLYVDLSANKWGVSL